MLNDAIDILQQKTPDEQFIQTLNDASNQHPYSSTLKTLLARATQLTSDVKFEDYVREAAIRTHNRKKLHDFVYAPIIEHTEVLLETDESVEITSPDQLKSELIENEVEEVTESKDEEGNIEDASTASQEIETNNTTDQSLEQVDEDEKISELERQFLNEVLSAGAALELLQEDAVDENDFEEPEVPLNTESEKEAIEQPKELDNNQNDDSIVDDSELDDNNSKEEDEKITTYKEEKHSLGDWLKVLDSDFEQESTTNETENEKELSQPSNTKGKESIEEAANIISNFIENESQIVPKRAEFFNPAKAAKSSLKDNDEIVTETLANIYAAQGNIKKAISTYEKLSLLHPEKSAYFAGLVKKLKRQQ